MPSVAEAPIQTIRIVNRDDNREQRATVGSVTYRATIVFPLISAYAEPPPSFLEGIADCEAGRTVDMDVALSQAPPDRAVPIPG